MPLVLGLVNPKGGVGKTTIAVHLAVAVHRAGYSTTLLDGDPQASVLDWHRASYDGLDLWGTTEFLDVLNRRMEDGGAHGGICSVTSGRENVALGRVDGCNHSPRAPRAGRLYDARGLRPVHVRGAKRA